jgi:hypothetical protein
MYDDNYTAADARADAYNDVRDEAIQSELDTLVQPIMDRVEEIEVDANSPRPLTRDQDYALVWLTEDDTVLREQLEEEYREEAEDSARDNYDSGPCCNSFYCPCGNSNNYDRSH